MRDTSLGLMKSKSSQMYPPRSAQKQWESGMNAPHCARGPLIATAPVVPSVTGSVGSAVGEQSRPVSAMVAVRESSPLVTFIL